MQIRLGESDCPSRFAFYSFFFDATLKEAYVLIAAMRVGCVR